MKTFLSLVILCFAAQAHAVGHLADMQVYDRSTNTMLQLYEHAGRHYIAGEPGHEYEIRLASRNGGRVLAVGSVDGVNVVSGDTASPDQGGYVLSPWENLSVAGWRTSLENVAAFYFTTIADSYAARTRRPNDVGVIGMALFRERTRCCDQGLSRGEAQRKSASDAPSPAAEAAGSMAERDERIGTGYGRTESSAASYTDFERASSSPDEVVAIYYDSYRNLCKQGIIPSPAIHGHRPDPFPGRFVPAP